MGTTAASAFRFPDPGSTVDVPRDIKNLATDVDTSVVMRFLTKTARDNTLVGALAPKNGMVAYTADNGLTEQYGTIGGWSGWTPLPGAFVGLCKAIGGSPVATNVQTPLPLVAVKVRYGTVSGTRYVPGIPGIYVVSGSINFAINATGWRTGFISLNGAGIGGTGSVMNAVTSGVSSNVPIPAMPVSLTGVTDYLELYAHQGSSVTLNVQDGGGPFTCGLSVIYAGQSVS